jgi:hypothetical protein
MHAHLRIPTSRLDLAEVVSASGIIEGSADSGLVFVASGPAIGDDWDAVASELSEVFRLTQQAVRSGAPVVYVVAGEDLLGQRGAAAAMVATGMLSAARTAAIETSRARVPINVVAAYDDASLDDVVAWIERLLVPTGATGEVVRVGVGHLGKALP